MIGAAYVDTGAVDITGPTGAVWSLPHGGDLDANLVVIRAGDAVDAHTNHEVDVLLIGVAGKGTVVLESHAFALHGGVVVHIPKGATRATRADADSSVVYLTVHRARAGLSIGRAGD